MPNFSQIVKKGNVIRSFMKNDRVIYTRWPRRPSLALYKAPGFTICIDVIIIRARMMDTLRQT